MTRHPSEQIKERNKTLAERYRSGESFRSLLVETGMSRHCLRKVLKSEGIDLSTKGEYVRRESMSEWHRRFGMIVSAEAMRLDISVQEIASELGRSTAFVNCVTRGEVDVSMLQYKRICEFLGLNPAEIIDGL